MAGDGDGDASDLSQLEEEFSVWKKNTPILYDLVISHPLEWPSLTIHWSPSQPQPYPDEASFSVHGFVLGTHTSDGAPNFLLLANAVLPDESASEGSGGESLSIPKVEINQKIRMDGEVNRARFMPQKSALVAVKTNSSEVYVVDCHNPAEKEKKEAFDPDIRLRGHSEEGYGLSWSPLKSGYLLSASHDKKICLWDVSAVAEAKAVDAMHIYEGHENAVGDATWHLKDENLFGSVGDDCQLMIWDLRTNKAEKCVKAHEKEVNSLSFNSYNEWMMATASSDTTVALFDMRKLTAPLHVLSSHEGEVLQVEWDPNHEAVLASSSDDRRVMIWDLNRIGDEQQEGDASDGPPELLFSHGGHKAKISDFAWNKHIPWLISSVAEDNAIQVWQMAESIYRDDDFLTSD
ncbi:hypothetical protein SAY86_026126 [Trapa natans]|uniref:Histone-binding protein RBBP4-like N-terminal domain-containing protein n=1 Tax=Trapa natans TaxID=22666 RepID=A0AAN7KJ89_TRANT|nr:hypothetical protein SAY86_026126 [Trapa natans]